MQALPTVYNKILGICYLQNERKEQLLQQWHTRVTESDAFLVEAEPEDGLFCRPEGGAESGAAEGN